MDAYIHKLNLPFIHILPIAFIFKKGIQEVAFVCVCVCVGGGGGGGGGDTQSQGLANLYKLVQN